METTVTQTTAPPAPSNVGNRQSLTIDSALLPLAYDGSHLSWQDFRSSVLVSHGIHVAPQAPENRLPFELWKLIDHRSGDISRFDDQKKEFKAQVASGQGFGQSPLFPPNLLPPLDSASGSARCMLPRFRREPLPERTPDYSNSRYALPTPRPGLCCGFVQQVFDPQEFAMLPHYLTVGGTDVNFETGYVSSQAGVHCPFLMFERTAGTKKEQVEQANNSCAIAGSWALRAVHMLYNKAYKSTVIPDLPTAFSCVVDNSLAVLNYHWIDHAQEFYMAPLCKFDLTNEAHFAKFLVWMEAIEDWGIKYQLPRIKAALARLILFSPTPTVTAIPALLSPTSNSSNEGSVVRALQTTFESIPWRVDDADITPVSSVASWGSPKNMSDMFSPTSRASTHSWGSPIDEADFPYPNGPATYQRPAKNDRRGLSLSTRSKPKPRIVTTPPAVNPSILLQRHLNEAQEEIRDLKLRLHLQQSEAEESIKGLREEVASMKELFFSFLRREHIRNRAKSLPATSPSTPQAECFPMAPSQVQPPLQSLLDLRLAKLKEPDSPSQPETDRHALANQTESNVETESPNIVTPKAQ